MMKIYQIRVWDAETKGGVDIDIPGALVNVEGVDVILHHTYRGAGQELDSHYWTATERRSGLLLTATRWNGTRKIALEEARERITRMGPEEMQKLISQYAVRD